MTRLAIFDLDHTLINTDSDNAFPQFLIEKGLLNAEEAAAKNAQFYHDYQQGCLKIEDFVAFQIAPICKFNKTQLNQLHQEFMQKYITPYITDAARTQVQQHRDSEDELLVISSTNEFIITPICHALGIKNIIGTQLQTDATGHFTGKIVGTPSLQAGKIIRLQQWFAAQGKTREDYTNICFYSDSINDLPLLQWVDEPIVVNPDNALRAHAQTHNWRIMSFE